MEEGMDRRTIRPDVLMLMANQGETKASILSLLCILRGVIGGLKGQFGHCWGETAALLWRGQQQENAGAAEYIHTSPHLIQIDH